MTASDQAFLERKVEQLAFLEKAAGFETMIPPGVQGLGGLLLAIFGKKGMFPRTTSDWSMATGRYARRGLTAP